MFTIPEPYTPDTPPLSDSNLRKLVQFSNDNDAEFGITLILESGVISGTVISADLYFSKLTKDFQVPIQQSPPFAEVLQSMKPSSGGYRLPNFIHLKDAKFFVGSSTIPTDNGLLWRGRIASVSGFTIGSIVTD